MNNEHLNLFKRGKFRKLNGKLPSNQQCLTLKLIHNFEQMRCEVHRHVSDFTVHKISTYLFKYHNLTFLSSNFMLHNLPKDPPIKLLCLFINYNVAIQLKSKQKFQHFCLIKVHCQCCSVFFVEAFNLSLLFCWKKLTFEFPRRKKSR